MRDNAALEVWELAGEAEKEQHVRPGANQGTARPKQHFRKKIGSTQSEAVGRLVRTGQRIGI